MEYKILEAFTLKQLEAWVREDIARGWKPQGGVSYYPEGYTQAMVRDVANT